MTQTDSTQNNINQETSTITWSELQRFFAQGLAVYVSSELDLVDVAYAFSKDHKTKVASWMQNQQVHLVTDQQATQWANENPLMWAVVVKPWILVQTV